MIKVTSEGQDIYTWESNIGSLDEGTFMGTEVTFDQFMFAMGIDDPTDVDRIRKQCAKIKQEFEEELQEPIGVHIQVKQADGGLEVLVASSVH